MKAQRCQLAIDNNKQMAMAAAMLKCEKNFRLNALTY
jgi:hypothetical protein